MSARPRIVVATTFVVHPPTGGGQVRVAGLYGALARSGVDVDVVALAGQAARARTLTPAPGLRELQVPKPAALDAAEWELQKRAGVVVSDLAFALHHELAPAYGDALASVCRGADAVVACHPYPHPALAASGLPLIYEAQDVEADLKATMYARSAAAPELVAAVEEVEAACCAAAGQVTVCSDEDGRRLAELYRVAPGRLALVPNGADPAAVPFTAPAERRASRRSLGLGRELLALFIGSWHEPNLVAVEDILRMAPDLEHVRFVIVGSAGRAFGDVPVPANVDLCGVVDARFMLTLLSLADVAVNPMRFGSGSNLKMLDYALAGVPVVSSRVGARGFGLEPGRHYVEAEPDALPDALDALRREPAEETETRVRAARAHAEERFSWDGIARDWRAHSSWDQLADLAEVGA
jgi:glycosyltransferase involved in cell wall biosynthesis